MLPQTTLGKTGLSVTQLGYGSMGLRGPRTWGVRVVDERSAERFLHGVLDSGINFIDTSPDYGISEERIGRYLSTRRDQFVIATKCGCVYTQHEDHLEIDHHWKRDVIEPAIWRQASSGCVPITLICCSFMAGMRTRCNEPD